MNGSRNKTCIYDVYEQLGFTDRHHLSEKGWIKVLQSNESRKQTRISILLSDKQNSKMKGTAFKSREQLTKKAQTILNFHAPNCGTPNFIKSVLLELKTQVNISP